MKFVYIDPTNDNQVMAEIDSPKVTSWPTWEDRGYIKVLCPAGLLVTNDHRVIETGIDSDGELCVVACVSSLNPRHQERVEEAERERISRENRQSGLLKLYAAAGLTQAEIDAQEVTG